MTGLALDFHGFPFKFIPGRDKTVRLCMRLAKL